MQPRLPRFVLRPSTGTTTKTGLDAQNPGREFCASRQIAEAFQQRVSRLRHWRRAANLYIVRNSHSIWSH